jgi:hypothetical protein
LNAELFRRDFLSALEPVAENVGILIFEFSRFQSSDFSHGRAFLQALEPFLEALPKNWPYGIEIRNASLLRPEYFCLLARHGITHVFNSWDAMPGLAEQMALPHAFTTPRSAARLLLKPGRKYEEAVNLFEPYATVQEPLPATRDAAVGLIQRGLALTAKNEANAAPTLIYVNNRLEGNALGTILAMLEAAGI